MKVQLAQRTGTPLSQSLDTLIRFCRNADYICSTSAFLSNATVENHSWNESFIRNTHYLCTCVSSKLTPQGSKAVRTHRRYNKGPPLFQPHYTQAAGMFPHPNERRQLLNISVGLTWAPQLPTGNECEPSRRNRKRSNRGSSQNTHGWPQFRHRFEISLWRHVLTFRYW